MIKLSRSFVTVHIDKPLDTGFATITGLYYRYTINFDIPYWLDRQGNYSKQINDCLEKIYQEKYPDNGQI